MEKKTAYKNDIKLVIVVVILAVAGFIFMNMRKSEPADQVEISVNGEVVETYELKEDRVVTINGGTNVLHIEGGKAFMSEADCPDQVCVKHKPISKNNENIICLPNKVVVNIKSTEKSQLDGVTN